MPALVGSDRPAFDTLWWLVAWERSTEETPWVCVLQAPPEIGGKKHFTHTSKNHSATKTKNACFSHAVVSPTCIAPELAKAANKTAWEGEGGYNGCRPHQPASWDSLPELSSSGNPQSLLWFLLWPQNWYYIVLGCWMGLGSPTPNLAPHSSSAGQAALQWGRILGTMREEWYGQGKVRAGLQVTSLEHPWTRQWSGW